MNVGASVDFSAQQLLRGHVRQSPRHGLRLRETLRRSARCRQKPQLRQPEIQNLQSPVVSQSQVARLQVAMNDSVFVRGR